MNNANSAQLTVASMRTGVDAASIAAGVDDHLRFHIGRHPRLASPHDWYAALAFAVRDRLLQRWQASVETLFRPDVRCVAYLSAEFLMGPHLGNNLVNLGIYEETRKAMTSLGLDLDALIAAEEEPGLGNGGLG